MILTMSNAIMRAEDEFAMAKYINAQRHLICQDHARDGMNVEEHTCFKFNFNDVAPLPNAVAIVSRRL
jgi:hypothetical protein